MLTEEEVKNLKKILFELAKHGDVGVVISAVQILARMAELRE